MIRTANHNDHVLKRIFIYGLSSILLAEPVYHLFARFDRHLPSMHFEYQVIFSKEAQTLSINPLSFLPFVFKFIYNTIGSLVHLVFVSSFINAANYFFYSAEQAECRSNLGHSDSITPDNIDDKATPHAVQTKKPTASVSSNESKHLGDNKVTPHATLFSLLPKTIVTMLGGKDKIFKLPFFTPKTKALSSLLSADYPHIAPDKMSEPVMLAYNAPNKRPMVFVKYEITERKFLCKDPKDYAENYSKWISEILDGDVSANVKETIFKKAKSDEDKPITRTLCIFQRYGNTDNDKKLKQKWFGRTDPTWLAHAFPENFDLNGSQSNPVMLPTDNAETYSVDTDRLNYLTQLIKGQTLPIRHLDREDKYSQNGPTALRLKK